MCGQWELRQNFSPVNVLAIGTKAAQDFTVVDVWATGTESEFQSSGSVSKMNQDYPGVHCSGCVGNRN